MTTALFPAVSASVYQVYIGGQERRVLLDGSFDLQLVTNGIDTFTCSVESEDGTYRPAIREEVTLYRDSVLIFGGIITQAPEQAFGGPALDSIITNITASSFKVFASYAEVTGTVAAGTLKQQLTDILALEPAFASHGITLHASQANGPSMPEVVFTRTRGDATFDQLTVLTDYAYLWTITADKKLRMTETASTPAPFDILDTGDPKQVGDMRVEPTLDDQFMNAAAVEVTGAGPATSTEIFTAADGVTSGGFVYFTSKYPCSYSINDAWPNEFLLNGSTTSSGGIGRVGPGPDDIPSNAWDWDVVNHRLRYTIASGAFFPSGGDYITVTYAIAFPFTVTSNNLTDQGLYGIYRGRIALPEAMPLTAAQAYGDAQVNARSAVQKKVFYDTPFGWLEPGQLQHIESAKRNINEDCLIAEVRVSPEPDDAPGIMRHSVTAIAGSSVSGLWRNVYKNWLGGGSSGGSSVTGVAAGGGSDDSLYDAGNSGTAKTIDWNNGRAQFLTLTGNCTLTFSNPVNGGRYVLILKQDGSGGHTVTYPGTVKWDNDNVPWLSSLAAAGVLTTYMYVSSLTKYIGAWNSPYAL